MSFDDFCRKLSTLNLGVTDQALALLWFHDEKTPEVRMRAGELASLIRKTGLGNPNQTRLTETLRKSRQVNEHSNGFSLKSLARMQIRERLETILGDTKPKVDQDLGFLPRPVWTNTRGYVEKICEQMNSCFQFEIYDGAAVLARRLIETLIIESYEHLKRADEIKKDGEYRMLADLINAATGDSGINMARDAKKGVKAIKEIGDRSAHNRRFNATKPDLEKIQSDLRIAAEDLINIADLRRK
ncbi:MAG TPA: hypothetical protein VK474_06855 [Chthoniobacterales bacterium]|nr:hypothetical protein [Chthoniobacterales bacterium]